jgi:hypothetical protein
VSKKFEQPTISEVCTSAVQAWIPFSSSNILSIRENLEKPVYRMRENLLRDLRKDVSLYLYCIRELSHTKMLQTCKLSKPIDPTEVLRKAPLDCFKEILNRSFTHISLFDLETITKVQAQQLASSIITATTASTLAEGADLAPELAFSCGILKQFGMTLIAFSYPHIFQRELENLQAGEVFERRLSRILGYSPSLLGARIARLWNLIPEVQAVIDKKISLETPTGQAALTAQKLSELCRVGEAFARTVNPEFYPATESDWELVKREFTERLGPRRVKHLREELMENMQEYRSVLGGKLEHATKHLEERINQIDRCHHGRNLAYRNSYIKYCSPQLQTQMNIFYMGLGKSQPSCTSIDFFTKQLAPSAGFPSGCIYLLDPETLSLTPRLPIGASRLSDYTHISNITVPFSSNPVAVAYRSVVPVLEKRNTNTTKAVSCIAGSIGSSQRVGILYLEFDPQYFEHESQSPLNCFKALRHALLDSLNLY